MDELIVLLEKTASAVSVVAGRTGHPKLQRQLIVAALQLRNLAIALRKGVIRIPPAALPVCEQEVGEALAAAKAAKNEADFARVLIEANEAIATVRDHAVAEGQAAAMEKMAFSAMRDLPGAGLTPIDICPPRDWPMPNPMPFPMPRPPWWPPRPLPMPGPFPSPWDRYAWEREFQW
jgi:hypothetical protein